MNKQIFIGRVGKNAELRDINGRNYACFDLASSETRNGEKRTTWVQVRKFDPEGKITKYITKGTTIYVEGKPTVSAYIKDGNAFANTTIWCNYLEFCSAGQNSNNSNQNTKAATSGHTPVVADNFNDDLPF